MKKNSRGKVLKEEPKEHHLNTVPKSCLMYKTTSFIFDGPTHL